MDRLREGRFRPWLNNGDLAVLLAAMMFLLLGFVRHVRGEAAFGDGATTPPVEIAPEETMLEFPQEGYALRPQRQPACEIPCRVLDPLDQCPCWTGRAEALMLWWDGPQSAPLFSTAPASSGTVALDAASLQSGMAAGPRFSLFRHTGDTGQIEFTYFFVDGFTAANTLPGTTGGYVVSPGVLCCSPVTRLNEASAALGSSIQSFELNRRLPTAGRWQWLAGFRWVQWNEDLAMDAVTSLSDSLAIRNDTNNDLYGMQVGADTFLWGNGGPFWIEGIGKAGLFYNRSAQFTSYSLGGPQPEFAAGGTSTSRAAFVGELGATAVWQMNDWLALRLGWVAFWLGGIAQSPNQLDNNCLLCDDSLQTLATDTGGSAFVNGLTLGLEARW
jgi:hypothetical protein